MGKSLIRSAAAVSVLLMASALSHAAGLGKLTVISTLGQPFRAEIDLVSVKKEELSSLNAKLAAPDAFKQADLPYTSYVSNMKLTMEKRPNGDPYIKVTSFQPLNEPFVDFLVELSWQSGRLVRAYTALVDPPVVSDAQEGKAPEVKAAPAESAPAAVAAAPAAEPNMAVESKPAESSTAISPPVVAETAPAAPAVSAPTATESSPEPAAAVAQPAPAPKPEEKPAAPEAAMAPIDVMVKRGDTLAKIARAAKPEEVTLEQMLVLLYRSNPEAFAGKNMNRLKAGKVLRLPDATQYDSVSAPEAKKIVRVQAANWRAYREKLASAVAASTGSENASDASASGKVTTTIEDKTAGAAEAPKEVLKLSKGESGKTAAVGSKDAKAKAKTEALEEEAAAKGKAAKDSGERVAQLEQNLKNMQELLELKNKGMSDLQKPALTPPAETKAPETKSAEVVPPVAETKPTEVAPAQTTEPAKPAEATPPAATEQAAPVKKKPKFVPPPPPPEPTLMDRLMDPTILGGIGLLAIAGLVGGFFWKRRRAAAAGNTQEVVTKGVDLDGGMAETPVIGGGAPVIPLAVAAAKGMPADAHEEGDPVAEAEIFLTYGRDTLAEDRLKEAIVANPKRPELHVKLLEIYANRKDANAFEQVAKELQVVTGGKGEIWNRAARMGYELDPSNSRYAAGRPSEEEEGVKTVVAGAGGLIAAAAAAASAPAHADQTKTSLDFNLGMDESNDIGTTTDIDLSRLGREVQEAAAGRTDIDLSDLAGIADATTQSVILDPGQKMPEAMTATNTGMASIGAMSTKGADLDFDFDVSSFTTSKTGGASSSPANDGGLSFDLGALDLDLPASGKPEMPPPAGGMPELDLSGISLDLGSASNLGGAKDDKWYDVQTKFDLAKAYQEMGDKDGAREILQEVIAEGDDDQKAAATAVLSSLV